MFSICVIYRLSGPKPGQGLVVFTLLNTHEPLSTQAKCTWEGHSCMAHHSNRLSSEDGSLPQESVQSER